jgi:hypothetical protein
MSEADFDVSEEMDEDNDVAEPKSSSDKNPFSIDLRRKIEDRLEAKRLREEFDF